jgi:hypothetical protein
MTASKKKVERWRLEQLRSFISDFPNGVIQPTEEPDFLVNQQGYVLGIELTDLYRKAELGQVPEQAAEAMRQRVVARAQQIYCSWQLPPVLASFFLDDRAHIKKPEVDRLARALANLVARNVPEPNSTIDVTRKWNNAPELPGVLRSLSVHRMDAVSKTFFSSPGATWVVAITREDIMRALSDKEPRYPIYRGKCDEVWLVINSDIEPMSTWFEFDMAVLTEPFSTRFDRVLLVQHFSGKAHELCLERRST